MAGCLQPLLGHCFAEHQWWNPKRTNEQAVFEPCTQTICFHCRVQQRPSLHLGALHCVTYVITAASSGVGLSECRGPCRVKLSTGGVCPSGQDLQRSVHCKGTVQIRCVLCWKFQCAKLKFLSVGVPCKDGRGRGPPLGLFAIATCMLPDGVRL